MEITLLAPGFLFLLAALPVVWLWPARRNDRVHRILRAVALALLALALARPVTFVERDDPRHVVLVDASVVDRAGRVARDLPEVLGDDATRMLVVAGGSMDAPEGYDAVDAVESDGGASPLAAGLAAAARAIPRGAPGAVTLISDGLATSRRWGPTTQALAARGIPVHVVAVPHDEDVRPVRLEVVGHLRVGHTGRVRAHVVGGESTVDVRLIGPSGTLAEARGVRVEDRALVTLAFEPKEAGFLLLAVEVVVRSGENPDLTNDRLETIVAVQDPLRALYLGGRVKEGGRRLGEIVGSGFAVQEDLAPADADVVVLDDRLADDVPDEMQSAIVRAVTDRGAGLFYAGGRAAFGPGGWKDTPVAALLPVDLVQREEKRDPSTTLVVIIDTSGSMMGNRVQLAKEVARLALRRLLPHDKCGIVEFYGSKRWAAPIQPASNAIEIQRALNRLQAGGGTVILPAIEEAFYALQNVRTRYKHVLVLTDGGVERGSFEPLLRKMAEEKITVSTVLVGPQAHSEFLVSISNWGKGRFYSVPNRFNLPEVLLKQPASARLPAYRPGTFPLRTHGGAGWWGAVDPGTVPPLAGYVETRTRPGATTLLEVERGNHPVLATWRHGLGRVTAFATEPAGPGTASWRNWDGYGPFLARVLARTASHETTPFRFSITRRGDLVTVTAVSRAGGGGGGDVSPTGRIVGSGGDFALTWHEIAPGRFEATRVLDPDQEARVLAGAEGDPRVFRLVSPARADVAAEGSVDPRHALDLEALARVTGGAFTTLAQADRLRPTTGGGTAPVGIRSLAPWLLGLALLVFLGDVAWRRRPRRGRMAT